VRERERDNTNRWKVGKRTCTQMEINIRARKQQRDVQFGYGVYMYNKKVKAN
jgi:hypothetical protein